MSQRAAAWLAWSLCALSLALTALSVLLSATSPGPIISLGPIQNPLALVESLPIDYKIVELVANTLMLVAVISLFIRLRRAGEQERQQIKWFVYAIALAIGGAVLTFPVSEAISSASLKWIGFVPFIVGVVFIPISMGIAIMRYRLYDIDLLINRTLVYGSLTTTLVALYFGGIVLLQRVFVVFTGQKSTLAVVASTLLIAALFNPSRHRIQSFIDRRFYRRMYDARKTLAEFSARLRDETDLEALNAELVGVVRDTMQPTSRCGCVPIRLRRVGRQSSSALFTGVRGRETRGSSNTKSCISRVPWSRMMMRGPMPHERRGLHVVDLNRHAEK